MCRKSGLRNTVCLAAAVLATALMSAVSRAETIQDKAQAEEPQMQWVWGEIVSLDRQKKEMSIKYLDYEMDQEKEIAIDIDDTTTFENAQSLEDLKQGDTLSIDYTVSAGGKNIARNVSVEKPEEPLLPLEENPAPPAKKE